jgi:thiol-disulfide isomerase/thioredoxin
MYMKIKSSPWVWVLVLLLVLSGSYYFYHSAVGQMGGNPLEIIPQREDLREGEPIEKDLTKGEEALDGAKKTDTQKMLFPDFSLKNMDGEVVTLSSQRGKVVVLNFWASWCPPCREEMPELQALHEELSRGDEAVFLAIHLADSVRERQNGIRYMMENRFTMTNLIDEGARLGSQLRIQSIPTTFIIDKDGYVQDMVLGATTKDRLLRSIKEVVS